MLRVHGLCHQLHNNYDGCGTARGERLLRSYLRAVKRRLLKSGHIVVRFLIGHPLPLPVSRPLRVKFWLSFTVAGETVTLRAVGILAVRHRKKMRAYSDPHKFVTTSFKPSLYVSVFGTADCGISNATFPVTCSPGFEFDIVFIALRIGRPYPACIVRCSVFGRQLKEKRITKHLILLVVIRARHVKHHVLVACRWR